MDSLETQIRDIVVEQHYNVIDKNMSIGCGEPFKKAMSKLIDLFIEGLLTYFELSHKPVINGKRIALKEIKDEINLIAESNSKNESIRKIQVKINEFNI